MVNVHFAGPNSLILKKKLHTETCIGFLSIGHALLFSAYDLVLERLHLHLVASIGACGAGLRAGVHFFWCGAAISYLQVSKIWHRKFIMIPLPRLNFKLHFFAKNGANTKRPNQA
jgi:hypothetical protein